MLLKKMLFTDLGETQSIGLTVESERQHLIGNIVTLTRDGRVTAGCTILPIWAGSTDAGVIGAHSRICESGLLGGGLWRDRRLRGYRVRSL
jgi:hypothetical protein